MKDIVVVVEGLDIINLYAIYDLVTGPEQPIYVLLCVQYETKNGGKDHESKQSSTTPDTGYQMGQYITISQFNATNESQEASPFQADDHKAAMSRRESTKDTNDPPMKYCLGTVNKSILLEGLNQFHLSITFKMSALRF